METTAVPRSADADSREFAARTISTVSWPAILAGAFVATSVSLVLFALGSGLGFASVSPWAGHGVSAAALAVTAAIWLIVMQWLSAAAGGYVAGRLRTRWHGTNPHEVFFRDTAHGLVMWAVSSVAVATIVASSVTSTVSGGAHAVSAVAGSAVQGAVASGSALDAYGLDRLLRPADPAAAPASQTGADPRTEVGHILARAMMDDGTVSDSDRAYMASLVASKTGASSEDARKRVEELIASVNEAKAKAEVAADSARKAAAEASLFTALSLVIGAFIACLAAAVGGRLRDEHP